MEIATLFNFIPVELQIKIATEYLGGWKYKNGKFVFDFSYLYDKIPKVVCKSSSDLVYDSIFNEYTYTIIHKFTLKLKIKNTGKTYVFDYKEKRNYDESEIQEEVDADDEGELITVPYVDPKGGSLFKMFYLQLLQLCYYDDNIKSIHHNTNETIIIDNMDGYAIRERLLYNICDDM